MSKTEHIYSRINKELKDKFKKACIDNDESQNKAINRMVRHYVDTNGNLTEKK